MYKFEKINEDTYKLITDEKEFIFTRTVDLAKELQKLDLYTTSYLVDMLAERGETIDNTKLRIEKKVDGKIIVDESNLNFLKQKAKDLAFMDVLDKITKKIFGIDFITTLSTINVDETDTKGIENFTADLGTILVKGMSDNSPRGEN